MTSPTSDPSHDQPSESSSDSERRRRPKPSIELIPIRPRIAADTAQTVDVLVRISAPEPDCPRADRPPLNVGLVIDRSGSMAGDKLK